MLKLAHQFSLATYSIVVTIGITQGLILGEAIVERFPRMLSSARLTSILLFLLFAANAMVNVLKFAEPQKVTISHILASQSAHELGSLILQLIGFNAGGFTIIAFSTTLLIFILLKFTSLKAYSGGFVFIISLIMIIITSLVRLSDYRPSSFEIIVYTLYQAGMTAGIIWGTRRKLSSKDLRFRYFCERWTGKQQP